MDSVPVARMTGTTEIPAMRPSSRDAYQPSGGRNLDRIRSAETLLLDGAGDALACRQEERPDGRRNDRGNFRDSLIRDHTGTAGHV